MAVHEIRHPLIGDALGRLRRADQEPAGFRAAVDQIARLLVYEATRKLPTRDLQVVGWAGPVSVQALAEPLPTLVPILRAGLGLLPGALALLPQAAVSIVGLERNEQTLAPQAYYCKLAPALATRPALVLDPMIATGGSLAATLAALREAGCNELLAVALVAAPAGLERVLRAFPQVEIYVAAIDQGLNADGYILPGLGDAGDRIFATHGAGSGLAGGG
jgi:uracil phosphoribosyltransferase